LHFEAFGCGIFDTETLVIDRTERKGVLVVSERVLDRIVREVASGLCGIS